MIYVMGIDLDGRSELKVGYSKDPRVRLGLLRVGNPFLVLLAVWEGSRLDEHRLHKRLASSRIRAHGFGSEWFNPSSELSALIVSNAVDGEDAAPDRWEAPSEETRLSEAERSKELRRASDRRYRQGIAGRRAGREHRRRWRKTDAGKAAKRRYKSRRRSRLAGPLLPWV